MQAEQWGPSTEQRLVWCLDAQEQCHPQLPGPTPVPCCALVPSPVLLSLPCHSLAQSREGSATAAAAGCALADTGAGANLSNLCSCRLLLCPPGQPAGQAQLTLLCSSCRQFSPIFQSRICSASPRQTTTMLFLSDISFCLLILILPVYGSVLLQGFTENRKNNTFLTCRY